MLTKVKHLAADALRVLRDGARIPIRESKTRVGFVSGRRTCPKYEVVPGFSEVIVVFEVPGATSRNTELCWSSELHTLSMRVDRSGEQNEDFSAVLAFSSDVNGSRGKAVLKAGTLRVRLPRRDVDTFTALPEVILSKNARLVAAAYA